MRNLILTGLLCGSVVVGASTVFAGGPQLSEQEMIEGQMQVEQSSSPSTPARQNQPQLLSESDLDEITAAGPFMLPSLPMMLPLLGTHTGHQGLGTHMGHEGLGTHTGHAGLGTHTGHAGLGTHTGHEGLGTHPGHEGLGTHPGHAGLGTHTGHPSHPPLQ